MIIDTIYLDMDGVLADFDSHWVATYGSKKDWCDVRFKDAILQDNLFEKLEPLEDARLLVELAHDISWEYGVEVFVLTSVGTTDQQTGMQAANQKRKWLLKNRIPFKPIFVTYLEQKGFYATPSALLVDDNSRATNAFTENGGLAICHTKPYDAQKMLYTMFDIRERAGCQ